MRKTLLRILFLAGFAGILISGCQDAAELEQANYYVNGMSIYKKSCQNCHGESGEGLGELVPPLTDTLFMRNNRAKLACIIRNGSKEEMLIHGRTYKDEMKGFPEMTDIDVAEVIVYITNNFGNKQGMYKYEQVALDLANCK